MILVLVLVLVLVGLVLVLVLVGPVLDKSYSLIYHATRMVLQSYVVNFHFVFIVVA